VLLLLLLQVLGDEFSQLGCKVFFSFDDSDREAASWAKENKAFAVITDDTDFMCYEGVDRIWSANIKLPTGEGSGNVMLGGSGFVLCWGCGGGCKVLRAGCVAVLQCLLGLRANIMLEECGTTGVVVGAGREPSHVPSVPLAQS
jgi:hypothetical protein